MWKVLAFTFAATAFAQQPQIANTTVRTLAVSSGLKTAIGSAAGSGPVWIGWAVRKIAGDHDACCWSDNARGCGLEGHPQTLPARDASKPVALEGAAHAAILLRYESGTLRKVRALAIDCALDGGGVPFVWLTGVSAAESVAFLESVTEKNTIHPIALHAAPEADRALERMAASTSESRRRDALFWLASTRGRRGYEIALRAAREDTSKDVRAHAVFALSRSAEPEAAAALARIAREDPSVHVRGQALFWLAKEKGDAAPSVEAIDRDPNVEIRKKAVFALSQLPRNEGVPRLIRLAEAHRDAEVRKQALFWLSRVKDTRASAFFEQVLAK